MARKLLTYIYNEWDTSQSHYFYLRIPIKFITKQCFTFSETLLLNLNVRKGEYSGSIFILIKCVQ